MDQSEDPRELDVEPQEVVPGYAESTDGRL
jgi:hypothetical protein